MGGTELEAEISRISNETFYSTSQMVELPSEEVQERESGSNEQVDTALLISEQELLMLEPQMPKQAMGQTGVERRRKYHKL